MSTNRKYTVLASASQTTTQTVRITNNECSGVLLVVDVTSAGTGSITPQVNIFGDAETTSGIYWKAAAAITTTSINFYLFYPQGSDTVTALAGSRVLERLSIPMPNTFNLIITANNANAMTYSVALYELV